jgi:NAD(P)-dependent dehydrogenase (short-subunit alcohol dehydrogenase family)
MSAPFVLITGATRGIGAAAAVELARRGAEVALVGRDPERVRAVADRARAAGGGGVVHEHVADLASVAEVRRLAAEVLERHPRVDVLANNAGAMFTARHTTPDGFERTFALNHLAPFLLTELLRERLAADGGGRVVTTASDAHGAADLDLDDCQFAHRPFRAMRVYGTTKLMNILFTRELARRAGGEGITATCFHPGVVRTGFGKNDGLLYRAALTAAGPFLRSPAKGARSLVWLALDPAAAPLSGVYVVDEQVKPPSAAGRDDVLAEGLWEHTEALLAATAA